MAHLAFPCSTDKLLRSSFSAVEYQKVHIYEGFTGIFNAQFMNSGMFGGGMGQSQGMGGMPPGMGSMFGGMPPGMGGMGGMPGGMKGRGGQSFSRGTCAAPPSSPAVGLSALLGR